MISITLRTVCLFLLLTFAVKCMGKRQLGQLEVGELVSALLISEVAVLPIDDPDVPLLAAVIPVVVIVSCEILLSYIKNKRAVLKRVFDGAYTYIIYKGSFRQRALADNRLSVEEVLAALRALGYPSLEEIDYAILEHNGQFSVVPKGECRPLTAATRDSVDRTGMQHPVIVDGVACEKTLRELGYGAAWLQGRLKHHGVRASEVFLLTVDDEGTTALIRKETL